MSIDAVLNGEKDFWVETGDALECAKRIPDESIQCIVTSPPYWGLRDYLNENQLGQEESPQEYLEKLVEVFRECKRILRKDGILILNIGDSYSSFKDGKSLPDNLREGDGTFVPVANNRNPDILKRFGLKPKDLCGVPERLVLMLQADGWYYRSRIAWEKPSCMPYSGKDRPTDSWEPVYLLTKSPNYFYDNEAIKTPAKTGSIERMNRGVSENHKNIDGAPGQTPHTLGKPRRNVKEWDPSMAGGGGKEKRRAEGKGDKIYLTANRRSVWRDEPFYKLKDNLTKEEIEILQDYLEPIQFTDEKTNLWTITNPGFKGGHFACMAPGLVELAVLAGTSEKGHCKSCGKGWVRILEKEKYYDHITSADGKQTEDSPYFAQTGNGEGTHDIRHGAFSMSNTVGWQKGCKCDTNEVVPGIVFDPFSGAGTTGLVSLRLGRRYIGIELNPEYVKISNERILTDIEERKNPKPKKKLPKRESQEKSMADLLK